jgi:hypothetical protein
MDGGFEPTAAWRHIGIASGRDRNWRCAGEQPSFRTAAIVGFELHLLRWPLRERMLGGAAQDMI